MPDYQRMYYLLCKAVDDVIDPLEKIPAAAKYAQTLHDALLEAEDIYIDTSPYEVSERTEAEIVDISNISRSKE